MPHALTVGQALQGDLNATVPNDITGEFVDAIKGALRVTVAGSNLRVLTFDWTADANGEVEAIIKWPIVGTLLMLRHQPPDGDDPGDYDFLLLGDLHMLQGDIMGRQGLSLPVLGAVQRDKTLGETDTAGTDGIAQIRFGTPCVTSNIKLLIDSATAGKGAITKLFWRPDA